MVTIETEVLPEVIELSAEEEWAHFDAVARQRLDMSGEAFLQRLDAGEFDEIIDDPIGHPGVAFVAMLSRDVR